MSARNDGGPAFPERAIETSGMTLRDYFAARALPVVLSDPATGNEKIDMDIRLKAVAGVCYEIADAMLAERAKHGVSKP